MLYNNEYLISGQVVKVAPPVWGSCLRPCVVQTLLGAGADVNTARSDVSHVMFCTLLPILKTITCMIAHKPYKNITKQP